MRRLPLLLTLLCLLATSCAHRTSSDWHAQLLPRTELNPDNNALIRWRPFFPKLLPENSAIDEILARVVSPLETPTPSDTTVLAPWFASLTPTLNTLVLRSGEALQLPPITGPETPFPDHQPLRQLAVVRLALLKTAWLDGRHTEAIHLAVENLRLARAFLNAQEELVPLIQATSVWQLSLDGVYWLARQDNLSPEFAAQLQAELLGDADLAPRALTRAFRGEFTFFTRLVLARLPETHDVNLLLSSIGSLGMTEPEAPEPDEPRLVTPSRDPLDRDATLQFAADDISGWIVAFSAGRYPRGFSARHTQARVQALATEVRPFLSYATEDIPPTPERIAAADTIVAAVKNPVGKLFLVITTAQWEPVVIHVFRREAQRSALVGLLAWHRLGRPATWDALMAAGVLATPPADPFSTDALLFDLDPLNPRIWSIGPNGLDDNGAGSGENLGYPLDLTWPAK